MSDPIITVESLHKSVISGDRKLHILTDVSFSLERGHSLAVTGSSGAGKSTLLALLAGLDSADSGTVLLNGEDITALDEEGRAAVRAKLVGFVFQNFQLLPALTAEENIRLPLELAGCDDAPSRAENYLGRVGLAERGHHYPRQLSGGEQQRVALARAFAAEPAILFTDEPTGNLDTENGEKIADLLFEMNRVQDTTLVLVTHEAKLAQRCQQQLVLSGGRVKTE